MEITPAEQPRRGLFFSLRAKMIVAFILVALIPLGVMAYLDNRTLTVDLTHAANQTLLAAASQTAASLDAYINSIKNTLNVEAQLPVFSNLLSLPPEMVSLAVRKKKRPVHLLKDLQTARLYPFLFPHQPPGPGLTGYIYQRAWKAGAIS